MTPLQQVLRAVGVEEGYLMAFGVCVALARVGKWIVDQGPVSAHDGVPEELPAAELEPLMAEIDAPDGRIRYLKPVLELSETPPFFARPPVPLGYHRASWTSS